MDIKTLMSTLQSIESMTKINEADDPAAVIQKYTDMGKKPTADMPAFIDPKDGKVKYMDQGNGMGGQPQIKTMPSDWIQRYAPDLAAALAAQGGNKQGYGSQQKGGLFGIKGLGNFDQGTKVNTAQAGADATSAKFKTDKLKQLNDLIAKLDAETKGGNTDPALGKIDYSLAGGMQGGVGLKLKESLIREFGFDLDEAESPEVAKAQAASNTAPAAAAPAPAGNDLVSQLQAVMKELSDLGNDPEVAKALQTAQQSIEASQKAKAAKAGDKNTSTAPATQGGYAQSATGAENQGSATPAASGEKGSKPLGPTATTQEKMDRFVFLMKKKKEAAAAAPKAAPAASGAPAPATTAESTDYFINKLRLIESTSISEALTPEEEKELQAISKEVVGAATSGADGVPPEVLAAVKDFQGSATPSSSATPGSATQPAKKEGDPKIIALQTALAKAGAVGKDGKPIKADGVMGPNTEFAMGKFPQISKQHPDVKAPAGAATQPAAGPDAIPATADKTKPYWVQGTRYEFKQSRAGGGWQVTATPQDKLQWNSTRARSMAGYTGADDEFKAGGATQTAGKTPAGTATQPASTTAKTAPATTQPAGGAGKTTTTTSSSSVNGTLKMGKADGPITYNGKTVNPGDPQYAAAEQALIQASEKSRQARSRTPNNPALAGTPVTQGATQTRDRDFEESVLARIRHLAGM